MTVPRIVFVGRVLVFSWLLISASLLGCQQKAAPAQKPPPAKVTVAQPSREKVISYREYTGYLEPVESVSIRTRVRGFLQKIHFKEGAEVKKGDLLYEIDPREYEAQLARVKADLAKAEAELKRARTEEDRAIRARRTNAISEEDYLQKVAAKESAVATISQAQASIEMAQLDLSFTKITSPIDGKISRTLVNEGNLVGFNESTHLTTIVSIDPIHVYFDVPERNLIEYERLARETSMPQPIEGRIPIEVAITTETGFPHPGVIDFRENRIDSGTGTIRLRGRLMNPDRLLYPGLFARIRIPRGEASDQLTIPEVALMADQRGRYVYVVKEDNTVEMCPVTVGARVGPRVAIETGLNPTDWVIVNGLQKARQGSTVDPQKQDAKASPKSK